MHSSLGLVALVLLFASALPLQDRVFQNRAATDNLGLRRSTERLSALRLSSEAVRYHPEHSEGEDVVVRFGTNGGKSLCYQLPPCLLGKSSCAVIVSPLSALMREQVQTPSDDQRQIQLCRAGFQAEKPSDVRRSCVTVAQAKLLTAEDLSTF